MHFLKRPLEAIKNWHTCPHIWIFNKRLTTKQFQLDIYSNDQQSFLNEVSSFAFIKACFLLVTLKVSDHFS